VHKSLEELDEIRCLDVSKLGMVRENGQVQVFMEEDNYVTNSLTRIESLMQKVFGIPNALIVAVSKFDYLLATKSTKTKDGKVKPSKWESELREKAPNLELDDFRALLKENDDARAHIRKLLLADAAHQLNLGPFSVNVRKLKEQMKKKISERY
jgi:hypothetical protein